MTAEIEPLLRYFKALADPTRLRAIGLLAERSRTGAELASLLGVSPPTVSHHMRLLKRAGLVRESRQNPFVFWELDLAGLQGAARGLLSVERVRKLAPAEPPHDERRAVLRNFFDGPRLIAFPAQRKKKEFVFEEILRRLPRRKEYSEHELSRFIEAHHPDYCTIRRELVMGRYMERAAGVYRLTDKGRAVVEAG